MNFQNINWTVEDISDYQDVLRSLGHPDRIEWTKRVINTSMPLFAVKAPELRKVIKDILKGNYRAFLKLWVWEYYENTIIIGGIISSIKDFEDKKRLITRYAEQADNWATIDMLTFGVKEDTEAKWFEFSEELLRSEGTFSRRTGVRILFDFVDNER